MNTEEAKRNKRMLVEKVKETCGDDCADYINRKYLTSVRLSDGIYAAIEKPEMKKDFCYGWGVFGDTYDEANRRSQEFGEKEFIEKNLMPLERDIKDLENALKNKEYMKRPAILIRRMRDGKTSAGYSTDVFFGSSFDLYGNFDDEHVHDQVGNSYGDEARWLSDSETREIIDGMRYAEEYLKKRIDSYLKRYGLSKVSTWTYWMDE